MEWPATNALPILVVTGGAGRIATAVRPLLRDQYRIRLVDVREPPSDLAGDEYQQLDLTDFGPVEQALGGAQAVLHLAGNPSPAATWSEVRTANLEATRNVYEATRRQGVGKIVFASTNHVMGFYNLDHAWPIDTRAAIRPDSLYAVSKAFGEALARYYADAFEMSAICLRIGWFTPDEPNNTALNPLWVSTRDLAQIVLLSLRTSRRFGIYNATSNNVPAQWDLATARAELGYQPMDQLNANPVQADADTSPYVDPRAGVLGDGLH